MDGGFRQKYQLIEREVHMKHYGLDLTAWAVANYEVLTALPPTAQQVIDDLLAETEQAFDMEDLGKAWDYAGQPPSGTGDGWEDDDLDLWFDRMYAYLS